MRGAGTLLMIWVASACSFESRVGGVDAATAGDAAIGEDGATADAPAPDAPPAPVTCTTSDPDLRLCLELDDASVTTLAVDGSGHEHHATVSDISVVSRSIPTSSQAIRITDSSALMIADHSDFDLQSFTLTAWVQRTGLPGFDQSYGVVDFGRQQASLTIDDSGRVSCFVKVGDVVWYRSGGSTTSGEWVHAACTYANNTLCTYSFPNGSPTATSVCGNTDPGSVDVSVSSGGTVGALFTETDSLDSRLVGTVDSVRLYARVLSELEICTKAGLTGC